jgi:hypothetical protein
LLGSETFKLVRGALLFGGETGLVFADFGFGGLSIDFSLEALAVLAQLALSGIFGRGVSQRRSDEGEEKNKQAAREEGNAAEVHRRNVWSLKKSDRYTDARGRISGKRWKRLA